jgi:polar amino acid transport system substrate-binding protein
MAIAIPKGREQGRPFVGSFVQEVQTNGLLERIQQEAGLRGAIKAQP